VVESITVPIYKNGDKQAVVIIGAYHFAYYIQNFVQHPAVRVKSTCRGNYWGSSMWISIQQLN